MKTQIENFCSLHDACFEGHEWATDNCQTMQEVWQNCQPDWLVWVAICPGVLTDMELRLFAVFCAREALTLDPSPDPRSTAAVNVAERFAFGNATAEELSAAYAEATAAYADAFHSGSGSANAAYTSARSAAADASDAARLAARSAARSAAVRSAARSAAYALHAGCAANAAYTSARSAAYEKQAAWLRENTSPTL